MAVILSYGELEKKAGEWGKKAAGFMQGPLSRAGQFRGFKFLKKHQAPSDLKKNQTPSATGLSGAVVLSASGGDEPFRIATTDNPDAGQTLELLQEKEK